MKRIYFHSIASVALTTAVIALATPAMAQHGGRRGGGMNNGGNRPSSSMSSSPSSSSRSSSSMRSTPRFGIFVVNGYGAIFGRAFVNASKSEDLPALGKPTKPTSANIFNSKMA